MSTYELVKMFHQVFRHPVAESSSKAKVTLELAKLRLNLIAEELGELADALGATLVLDTTLTERIQIQFHRDNYNVVEVADALGDLDYVVQGANIVFGIEGPMIVSEIHKSNMSKLGVDGQPIYRADGKILKGPNYFKPNLGQFFPKKIIPYANPE